MATNRIKIEVDYEKAVVKVNDLKLKFDELGEKVTATRNRIKNAVKGTKDAIDGSVKSLMREKQEWQNVQASLSTTNEQYRKYQVQIDKIDAQIKRLTDTRSKERSVLAGSVTALEAQISKLKTLQNNLSTTNRQYREAQVAIDALRKRVEAITDTRKREEIALKNSAAGIQQQITYSNKSKPIEL